MADFEIYPYICGILTCVMGGIYFMLGRLAHWSGHDDAKFLYYVAACIYLAIGSMELMHAIYAKSGHESAFQGSVSPGGLKGDAPVQRRYCPRNGSRAEDISSQGRDAVKAQ
jgi:hypothetical protein